MSAPKTLAQALVQGDVTLIEAALQAGEIALDRPVPRQQTLPLHLAAEAGQLGVIQVLLMYGAQLNGLDPRGVTPLIVAIAQGHLVLAETLLTMGAKPTVLDRGLTSPLHVAAGEPGSAPLIGMLLEHGANLHARNAHGLTPLHVAARHGQRDAIDALCKAGADLQARDQEGNTPLLLAAREGQLASLDHLRRLGADPAVLNFEKEGVGHLIDPLLLQVLGRDHDLYWWLRSRLPVQRRHDPAPPPLQGMRPSP